MPRINRVRDGPRINRMRKRTINIRTRLSRHMGEKKNRVEWTTKVSVGLRISLSKKVAQDLGVTDGDYISFIKLPDGTYKIKRTE